MKTKIFLGCIMAASLITVSCSDLLQENPQGKLTPEGYFSTQEELDMSVYSLYSKVNYSQTRTNPALIFYLSFSLPFSSLYLVLLTSVNNARLFLSFLWISLNLI